MKTILRTITLILLAVVLMNTAKAQTTVIVGANSGANGTTTYPCPLEDFYYAMRAQYLYTAASLSAAGITSGSTITQLGWVANATTISGHLLEGYTISVANSGLAALPNVTSWQTGLTTVYGPTNYSYASGTAGNIVFNITPFTYTGGALLIEVCGGVSSGGYTSNPAIQWTTAVGYVAQHTYRADLVNGCGNATTTNTGTTTTRPRLVVTYGTVSPCASTPNAGTATGPSTVCSGASFTITTSGLSTGVTGLTYQWQSVAGSACPGAGWANIGGQTSTTLTTSQVAATSYRMMTTCTNTGQTNVTSCVGVAMSPWYLCSYNTTGIASSTGDEEISNVTITGSTTLNNSSTCATLAPGPGSIVERYGNYRSGTGAPAAPNIGQASSVGYSVTQTTCIGNYGHSMQIYIDYNQDGDWLDAGETVANPATQSTNYTYTGSFTVPGSATLGLTGMRVVVVEFGSAATNYSNTGYTWGETEDYLVNVVPTPPCSGTPNAGTATATPTPTCSSTLNTLNATGLSNAPGITYAWQVNNTATGGAWANIPAGNVTVSSGSASTSSCVVSGQQSATQYRIYTYCTNSSTGNNSNAVTLAQDIAANCYCIPGPGVSTNTAGDYIQHVNINGFDRVSGSEAASFYYGSPSVATLDIGTTYPLLVKGGTFTPDELAAWIDLNADGDFLDANEFCGGVAYTVVQDYTINVTIVAGATLGVTRLRVRVKDPFAYGSNTIPGVWAQGQVCSFTTYGETEDYAVTIQNLPNCTGTPTAGTTNSSDPSPCSGIPFNLTVSGATTGVGSLAYQWQTAPAAIGPWTDISGAVGQSTTYTFASATTTFFRRKMKCTASNLPYGDSAYSSNLSLTSTLCYCQPANVTPGTSTGMYISSFQVINGGAANVSGGAALPCFTYYSGVTFSVQQNAGYWLEYKSGTSVATHYLGTWVDYNQDGDFLDAGETLVNYQFNMSGAGGIAHLLMNVPATATLGTTRIRVRVQDQKFVVVDPCATTYTLGETEDYNLAILPSSCAAISQGGFMTNVVPNITTNDDAISFNLVGSVGTVIAIKYGFDGVNFPGVATVYPGDPIYATINPFTIVYFKAIVKNGGCPTDSSNVQFCKLDCHQNITDIGATFDNDFISNVQLGAGGSLMNSSSTFDATQDCYQNFKANFLPHLSRATSIPISVSTGAAPTGYPENIKVWIDEDQDGVFSPAECLWGNGTNGANTGVPTTGTFPTYSVSGNITIPCGSQLVGTTIMRVACSYLAWPTTNNPCEPVAITYGEVEEYSVYIDPLPDLILNPTAAVCQGQTAVLNASGGAGFAWTPTNGSGGVTMNPANGLGATVTVSTSTPSNVFFTVTGTLANGCTQDGIVPVATTPLAGTVTPVGSVICSGGVKLLTATGAAGVYQWQIATAFNGPWTDIAGATSGSSYTTAPQTANRYYRLMSKSTACWDIASNTVLVEIATTPVVTFSNTTGTSTTVSWTPTGGGSYSLSYSGAGTGSLSNVTPPVTLNSLSSNANLSVTVTMTNPAACAGVSAGTATTKTLCAAPTAPTFGAITTTTAVVNIPAGSWMVNYKLIQISNTYLQTLCLTGPTTYTITTIYPGAALSVYLQACNCPTTGLFGQAGPAVIQYLAPGTSTCPTPTPFGAAQVTSACPNQITVALAGNPSNTYRVTFRRLLPTAAAPTTYNVTGTSMTYTVLNTPLPQVWEVYATSTCGAAYGTPWSTMTQVVQVTVKGGCNKINNLVLSHPTCHGFTATWNIGDCGIPSTNLLGYSIFYQAGAGPVNGTSTITNVKNFSTLVSGAIYSVYVRANSCNGSFGPASDIQTIQTLSGAGCREEQTTEENMLSGGVVTENGTLSLFPNPNPGQFNIDLQTSDVTTQDVRIEVMNMLGQIVTTQITSISGGHLTENVNMPSGITSGTYMVRVMAGEKAVFTTRVNISK